MELLIIILIIATLFLIYSTRNDIHNNTDQNNSSINNSNTTSNNNANNNNAASYSNTSGYNSTTTQQEAKSTANTTGTNASGWKKRRYFKKRKWGSRPDFANLPYKYRPLLTETEFQFYRYLRAVCGPYNVLVCPKVRLEDIIQITTNNQHIINQYRGYIKSRHIDFMLCDINMKVICGIELDDPSHWNKKAYYADSLKNAIYNTIGIKLFRVKTQEDYRTRVKEIMMYAIPKAREAAPAKSSSNS